MAVSSNKSGPNEVSTGRRWAVGTNVVISVVIAAALLVAVNYISSLKYARKDIASMGQYGLSERTQRILTDTPDKIHLSLLYTPDPEDEKQQDYIERLQTYCDELRRYDEDIEVTHVTTDSQREKLVREISSAFGGEADKHKSAITSWNRLRDQLEADLQQRLAEANAIVANEGWLTDFPLFGSVVATLRADLQTLATTSEEIAELTPVGGIPKYAEATTKAKTALATVREHLTAITSHLAELASLAEETAKEDSMHIAMLRDVARQIHDSGLSLRDIIGEPESPMPTDISATLKNFADRGLAVGKELESLGRHVEQFAEQYPSVRQHQNWSARVRNGPFTMQLEVAGVLQQASQTLQKVRLFLLGVIDNNDAEQLQKALVNARTDVSALERNATVCEDLLTGLADRLARVDESSQTLMKTALEKTLFGDRVSSIETMEKDIGALPELKLGDMADQLKEDNAVVIETAGKIRVISFSEAFPLRQSVAGPGGGGTEDLGRAFNGDSAISSAILSLTQEKPFATVVLVSFEPPAPPQRNQFTPPPSTSSIPSRALSGLRMKMEAANFKVIDWNLAISQEAPKPDEGTEAIYVCLPPAPPAPPSPFGQPPQSPIFGDKERGIVRDLLDKGASILFLASWEVQGGGFMGGPLRTPPFGYAPLLSEDWGIGVETNRRIVWVRPDREAADTIMVVPLRFSFMPVTGFTEHPIGQPLRGTRFLVNNACPIAISENTPAGVTVTSVLRIPRRENYIGPELQELIAIIDRLNSRTTDGKITLRPFPKMGPFDAVVAATRTGEDEGENKDEDGKETNKGKIVVCGFGASVMDGFLRNPVPVEGEVFRLDPPPTESADLVVNSLYWLRGLSHLAARGPVPVPRIRSIPENELITIKTVVYFAWPAVVVALAPIIWYMRRR